MHKNNYNFKGKIVIIVICLLVLSTISTLSQTDIIIRGHVRDHTDDQPLQEAEIYIDDAENPADLTQIDGNYEATVDTGGVHKVTARKPWYISVEQRVPLRENVNICNFRLSRATRVRVGAVLSVTGDYSYLGVPQRNTLLMIAEKINKSGGINGYKMELIIKDDEGQFGISIHAMNELIHKYGVCVVLGPSLPDPSFEKIRLVEKQKIPLISLGFNDQITFNERAKKPFKWIFKIPPPDNIAAKTIYRHLLDAGTKKIAIVYEHTDYGLSAGDELKKLSDLHGIKTPVNESYDKTATDMRLLLVKIRSSDVDAVINWSDGPSQVVITRNRYEMGMTDIPLYQSPNFGDIKYIEELGDMAEGVLCPQEAISIWKLLPSDNLQKKAIWEYMNDYKTSYNEQTSFGGSYAWDAINLVVDAIKMVGPDSIQIRDYLEKRKDFVGLNGIFNFSPENHNGPTKSAFYITVVKDGEWTLPK